MNVIENNGFMIISIDIDAIIKYYIKRTNFLINSLCLNKIIKSLYILDGLHIVEDKQYYNNIIYVLYSQKLKEYDYINNK